MRTRTSQSPGRQRAPSTLTGGTLGGIGASRRLGAGRPSVSSLIPHGDAAYLWALVALELLAIGWLRSAFKRYHGG